jgi:DNA-directed RNA polymerase specialized sigma24 family protein
MQSAVVACLLDGLTSHEGAAAVGCTVAAFNEAARRLRRKLAEPRLTVRWIRTRGAPC